VDVEVHCANVVGVAAKNGFERGGDFIGALLGRAVGAIELPGAQIHHAVGEEGGGVEVVWVLGAELPHGAE